MKSRRSRIGKRRGFTLIELLVVIIILGVILVASIPSISRWLPRYRLDRVAENLVQSVRRARAGAVQVHCNFHLRFYTDQKRTTVVSSAPWEGMSYDTWMDRDNDFVVDSGGPDKVTNGPLVYKDVVIVVNPITVPGRAPYDKFSPPVPGKWPGKIVFKPDGRIYYEDSPKNLVPMSQCAILVKSNVLTGANQSDPRAIYKYRWVEIDQVGAVRLVGKNAQGN